MIICSIFRFEAAHKLSRSYNKDCMNNIHGHSYQLKVYVDSELDEDGMVMDFKRFKEIVRDVIKPYDHALIIDVTDPIIDKQKIPQEKLILFGGNPTAENMANRFVVDIYKQIRISNSIKYPEHFKVKVELYETVDNYVSTNWYKL